MEKQCRHVPAPALAALLPKLHLNRHTPHSVVFGDAKFGGLSLPHLYTDQGFQQLRFFIGHLCQQDDVGKLILITISFLQLLLGAQKPFFSLCYTHFAKRVEKVWVTSIWQHTSQLNMFLEVEHHWVPPKPREQDVFLMEYAMSLNLPISHLKNDKSVSHLFTGHHSVSYHQCKWQANNTVYILRLPDRPGKQVRLAIPTKTVEISNAGLGKFFVPYPSLWETQ
jgi:hypothetical protein